MTDTNKSNNTTPFKVGDIICGIKNNGYGVTNEHMKKKQKLSGHLIGL